MNDSLLLDALGHDAFDKLDLKLHHDLNTMPLSTLSPEEIQTFVEKLIIIDSTLSLSHQDEVCMQNFSKEQLLALSKFIDDYQKPFTVSIHDITKYIGYSPEKIAIIGTFRHEERALITQHARNFSEKQLVAFKKMCDLWFLYKHTLEEALKVCAKAINDNFYEERPLMERMYDQADYLPLMIIVLDYCRESEKSCVERLKCMINSLNDNCSRGAAKFIIDVTKFLGKPFDKQRQDLIKRALQVRKSSLLLGGV